MNLTDSLQGLRVIVGDQGIVTAAGDLKPTTKTGVTCFAVGRCVPCCRGTDSTSLRSSGCARMRA